ncbi:MAG: PIN domain-containing protein [Bryobacteraceae bacterium]|jgi:PIN domain nuclease of toxin-antitoxin system
MIAGVADTHAALWFLFGDPRLSAVAKDFFDKAAAARQKIALTPISLAEVVYPIEKNRLPASAFDDLRTALSNPNHVLEEAPFTAEVVQAMRQVPRDAIPDMPDRIVAATAVFLGVPLISRDGRIRASTVRTVW